MDAKDLKILTELDKNPRIATSKLAKKVRISQQVADYRLKKLVENKIIVKFGTIINLYRLNIQQYRIFFRFKEIGDQRKKEIFQYLKQHSQVYWAARIGGRYDLVIVIGVEDYPIFDSFLDALYNTFPQCFKDYRAGYVLTHELYKHKKWFKHGPEEFISYGTGVDVETIDDLDWNILQEIKDNCRVPALVLAQKFKTTYKTIQNRIRRLTEKGVILGSRLFVTDSTTERFIILLTYNEYSRSKEKKLIAELRQDERVTQTLHMFGRWRLFLHVRIENLEKLQSFIIHLREKYPFVKEHEVIPIFEDILIDLLPKGARNPN